MASEYCIVTGLPSTTLAKTTTLDVLLFMFEEISTALVYIFEWDTKYKKMTETESVPR